MSKILRLEEVMNLTGFSRSTIRRQEMHSDFPKRIYLTERIVGWSEKEVFDWIKSRVKTREKALKSYKSSKTYKDIKIANNKSAESNSR